MDLFCGRLTRGAETETREAKVGGEGSRLNEAGEGFFTVGKDALTRSMSEDADLWTWVAEIEFSFSF